MKSHSESYKAAGVDITAGYKAVELMKEHIAKTMSAGVMGDIGGFGGLFELDMTGITKTRTGQRYRRRWYKAEAGIPDG